MPLALRAALVAASWPSQNEKTYSRSDRPSCMTRLMASTAAWKGASSHLQSVGKRDTRSFPSERALLNETAQGLDRGVLWCYTRSCNSLTSCLLAQEAQQYMAPSASTPWPIILQPQWRQVGASAGWHTQSYRRYATHQPAPPERLHSYSRMFRTVPWSLLLSVTHKERVLRNTAYVRSARERHGRQWATAGLQVGEHAAQ